MTEITIPGYREGGVERVLVFGLIYIVFFSGLTMLGIWIFKFSDTENRLNRPEGQKPNEQYFDELFIPGLIVSILGTLFSLFYIYWNHQKP